MGKTFRKIADPFGRHQSEKKEKSREQKRVDAQVRVEQQRETERRQAAYAQSVYRFGLEAPSDELKAKKKKLLGVG